MRKKTSLLLNLAGLLAAAFSFTGCAYNTFDTVDTVPEAKYRLATGVGAYLTKDDAFYDDMDTVRPRVDYGGRFSLRKGSHGNTEWDYSLDGLWPGVGLKWRASEHLALKGEVHMPFLLMGLSPAGMPYFTGTLITGNPWVTGGVKFLSAGTIPGSVGRGDPDLGGFAGVRIPFYQNLSLMPEVCWFLRDREAAGGIALVIN